MQTAVVDMLVPETLYTLYTYGDSQISTHTLVKLGGAATEAVFVDM